jgi:Mlc titration factor MtfA (ptsG expression regulator)
MEAAFVCAALAAAVLLAWLTPRWRLRRALARPLTAAQLGIIERNVDQYRGMAPDLRAQLQRLVKQFLHQKTFVGCAGLEVTEEMRVTIAGQACLLLLNRPSRVYPGLHTVLVYPGAFLVPRREVDAAGVVTETRQDLLGESWGDGRVILSWDHVRRAGLAAEGTHNVVLHEFAHQLDSESGSTNGAPFLGNPERYRSWSETLSRDFALLRATRTGASATCSIRTARRTRPSSSPWPPRASSNSRTSWPRAILNCMRSSSRITAWIRATGLPRRRRRRSTTAWSTDSGASTGCVRSRTETQPGGSIWPLLTMQEVIHVHDHCRALPAAG